MELATLHLKLSGDAQNTVFLYDVSPAELAVYAYMHGEDCVQSLSVMKVDKDIDQDEILDRLRAKFQTENAAESLKKLFPGISPRLPTTFKSIGYDPTGLTEDLAPIVKEPDYRNNKSKEAAGAITKKIKEAAKQRKIEESGGKAVKAVEDDELEDEFDDSGDGSALDDIELDDEGIDPQKLVG